MAELQGSPAVNDPMEARFAREDAELEAQMQAQLQAQQPAEPINRAAVTTAPAVEPPTSPEQSPAPVEEPPAAEPPATEPPPPAPAPTPDAPAPQSAAPDRPSWRLVEEERKRVKETERKAKEYQEELRRERERTAELERAAADLRAENERRAQEQAQQAEQPYVDPYEERLLRLEAENQQRSAQLEQTQMYMGINNHVAAFVPTHPDYNQALAHLVETERRNKELNGDLYEKEALLRERLPAKAIREYAVEHDMTQAEAIRQAAVQLLVQEETQKMWKMAQRTGRNMAELVYERAQSLGFRGANGNGTQPNPAAQIPSPAEQLREEQTQAATGSLAGLATHTTQAPPREIESKADLEAWLKGRPYAEIAAYYDKRDDADPQWMQKLR